MAMARVSIAQNTRPDIILQNVNINVNNIMTVIYLLYKYYAIDECFFCKYNIGFTLMIFE